MKFALALPLALALGLSATGIARAAALTQIAIEALTISFPGAQMAQVMEGLE